jgi:hypothetical protein
VTFIQNVWLRSAAIQAVSGSVLCALAGMMMFVTYIDAGTNHVLRAATVAVGLIGLHALVVIVDVGEGVSHS